MSLRWRLALIMATTVAVTVTLASVGTYLVTADQLKGETDRFLVERAQQVTEELDARSHGDGRGGGPRGGPEHGTTPERLPRTPFDQPDALVQYVNESGTRTYSNSTVDLPVSSADSAVAAGESASVVRDEEVRGVNYRVLTAPAGREGAVQIARDLRGVEDVLSGLRYRLVLLGAAGTVVAASVGWFVARQFVRPVERLTAATETIAVTQELAESIDVGRSDEVGRLAESFNSMVAALRTAREQQRRLVQDASHELRTPLTSLRTNIEVLASEDRLAPEDRARLIEDVEVELVELTDLVNELVVLAHATSPDDEPPVEVRLDEVASAAADRARRRTGRAITVAGQPCTVWCRPSDLDRALTNLLSNATKFSPGETPIEMTVSAGRVAVRDHGPGFDAVDLPHVFERFYRSDAARSAPGSGLGLSIVEQFAHASGGSVFAEGAPGGGAVVGFDLPVDPGRSRGGRGRPGDE